MKRILSIFFKIFLSLFLVVVIGLTSLVAWGTYRIAHRSRNPIERLFSGESSIQKRPIVLVHGLNRSGGMWGVADGGHGNFSPGTRSMVGFLRKNGYPNLYLNTFQDTRNKSLLDNAKSLKTWIRTAKKHFDARNIDIITHSLGGLISRAYIQEMDRIDGKKIQPVRYEGDVANLIMIAAPHLGSPIADSIPSFMNWYARRTLVEGGGPDLQYLNSLPIQCEINYHSILVTAALAGQRRRWSFWRLLRAFVVLKSPLNGDGTVSLESQNLGVAVNTTLCDVPRHFSHNINAEPGIRHRAAPHSLAVQKEVLKILSGNGTYTGAEKPRAKNGENARAPQQLDPS